MRLLYQKTDSAFYLAPFIGSALSFLVFRESPNLQYLLALLVMATGTILAAKDWSVRYSRCHRKHE